MRERENSEELSVDSKIILKLILKEQIMIKLTGFVWLRIGRNGGLSNMVMNNSK
jgi:hypothetical protein